MGVKCWVFWLVGVFFSTYLEGGKRFPTLPVSLVSLDSRAVFPNTSALSLCLCQGWYEPGFHSKLQGLTGVVCTHNWGAQPGLECCLCWWAGEGAISLSLIWLLGSLHGAT